MKRFLFIFIIVILILAFLTLSFCTKIRTLTYTKNNVEYIDECNLYGMVIKRTIYSDNKNTCSYGSIGLLSGKREGIWNVRYNLLSNNPAKQPGKRLFFNMGREISAARWFSLELEVEKSLKNASYILNVLFLLIISICFFKYRKKCHNKPPSVGSDGKADD